jgi:chromosome segregation ATPase
VDALIVGAVVALITAALSAWAAWYGARVNARPQREGVAVTGLTSLTDQLQEERADLRQQLGDTRRELGDVRQELAAERVRCAALETECATLRVQLAQREGP